MLITFGNLRLSRGIMYTVALNGYFIAIGVERDYIIKVETFVGVVDDDTPIRCTNFNGEWIFKFA